MTTLSRDEIIAICITERMQNRPKATQLRMAKMPLIKMAAENLRKRNLCMSTYYKNEISFLNDGDF